MIKYQTVMEEIEKPYSVICNKCKKEYYCGEDWVEVQEFHTVNFVGGYGSIFGDGAEVLLHICQHCLMALIGDLVEESYRDKCPDCGKVLIDGNGGGVKCPDKECGYWFCL